MKKIIASILISSLLISGCAHNLSKYGNEPQVDFYYRVTKLCENNNDLTIEVLDGKKYKGKELRMTSDSTSFKELETNALIVLKTQEVNTISFTQIGRGIFEGFLYGSLIGGVTGLAPQLIFGGQGTPKGDIYLVLYTAITGAVIGSIYGLINKSKTIIKINEGE